MFYKQLQGTMKGSNIAPTYSNLFMAAQEEDTIYVLLTFRHFKAWWRFIDDLFAVWTGTEGDLVEFFDLLNDVGRDVKFSMSHSNSSIQFLENLSVQKRLQIVYESLCKTDRQYRNNLLKYDSHHPRATIDSLSYSQLLRVKRIVEDPALVNDRLDDVCVKFISRGYPQRLIKKHRDRTDQIGR